MRPYRPTASAELLTLVVKGAAVAFGMAFGERAAKNIIQRYEEARYA